jgi:DNA-binding phage protein
MEILNQLVAQRSAIRDEKVKIVRQAVAQAGSISRLARDTGVGRNSVTLWASGGVSPCDQNLKRILEWLACSANRATDAAENDR